MVKVKTTGEKCKIFCEHEKDENLEFELFATIAGVTRALRSLAESESRESDINVLTTAIASTFSPFIANELRMYELSFAVAKATAEAFFLRWRRTRRNEPYQV